ncbi:hypothetical protein CH63R_02658 [Colletotrichum higginsianum IMI 349063]|uniref:Uncharacterized protein n=2 Tax=Colletotrichum higginsianum TaxID=80884 RepID=A0A1B7YPQ2_COLHI|nr:hypothetical protein CH63R_02658 [Colletotrichum higginsianum IMI 349063]OBR13932.1 hypothetical protein CH63R_02658 [Colletotrichum higginsianum IMI 349063]TID02356.1 hypothetical protein CH35J_004109 [Colletotrichum higginsianum]
MAPYKQSLFTLLCLFFSVSLQGPLQPSRKDDGYQKLPAVAATSGLVARDRRPVPSLAQLGCDVQATGNGDWMEVGHGSDFVMQARVNGDTVYRKYAEHTNPGRRLVRARDVLMAFWKDYSNDAVGSLRHIEYQDMANKDTLRAIAYVQPWNDVAAFDYLKQKSPHASGSSKIPDEFQEFDRLYVSSFDWSDGDDDMDESWFRVNFRSYDE